MSKPLKRHHRMRVRRLSNAGKFSKLEEYLSELAGKGFDVAGIPFRVLDEAVSSGLKSDTEPMRCLAPHTTGAQPRLFEAILTDLRGTDPSRLTDIVLDAGAHPMTRFEAMGWAVFLTYRALPPDAGSPMKNVFQYWDSASPPPEVLAGRADWQAVAPHHDWYDDAAAHDYVAASFGVKAAQQYDALWHPALKSDVFRLYRLVQDGGLYCDADSHPGRGTSAFLCNAGDQVWAASMTQVPNCVAINGFMGAPPQAKLIEAFLEQVLRNLRDPADRGIFWLSGPGALTQFLFQTLGQFDMNLLPNAHLTSEIFRQFDAPYKRTDRNWRVYEHGLGMTDEAGLRHALAKID